MLLGCLKESDKVLSPALVTDDFKKFYRKV